MSPSPGLRPRIDHPVRGIALVVAAVGCFATMEAVAKWLTGTYPVQMVLWCRYFFHVALMALVLWPRIGTRLIRTRQPRQQALRGFILGLSSVLFFNGLARLPLADASAISSVTPILVTLAGVYWLGERAPRGTFWALAASFVGVLLIVRPGTAVFSWAALLPLGSALCYCAYQIMTRRLAGVDDPMATLFLGAVMATILMTVFVPLHWMWPQSWFDAVLMVTIGGIGAFGHLMLVKAFENAPVTLLAPFTYVHLVGSLVLGWLVFGNFPDAIALSGMLLIVSTGVAMALRQRFSGAPAAVAAKKA